MPLAAPSAARACHKSPVASALLRFGRAEPAASFDFYEKRMQSSEARNNSAADDLVFMSDQRETELLMTGLNESSEEIDRPTTRSICRAIGERLQQNLRPEDSELPSGLRNLMEELRRQDRHN